MKNILLIILAAFLFISCNKCKECKHVTLKYRTYSNNTLVIHDEGTAPFPANYEDHGYYIQEVCSDNFESKEDFSDYIDALEDTEDWVCKSDFWN